MTEPITYRRIALAPAEAEMWEWAADVMREFWATTDDREEGDRVYETAIFDAKDGVGLIVDDPEVANDLIYRVETQMYDMAHTEFIDHQHRPTERMAALRAIATGKRVATKVRKAFGLRNER